MCDFKYLAEKWTECQHYCMCPDVTVKV
jgi:hypothetical protein